MRSDNMRSNYKSKTGSSRASGRQNTRILYDARGVRIRENRFSAKLRKFLLFGLLPYLILNGLIFAAATAAPKIEIRVADTNDYRSTEVEFTVKSLLPLKSLTANIESQDVPFEKAGSVYKATVNLNGTLYVDAEALNGMHASEDADISVLDATAPQIPEETCDVSGGNLRFTITDSQSGVNFDSIYGIYDGNKEVRPESYDRDTGVVVIPLYADSIQLHAEDMVGNAMSVTISTSTDYGDSTESSVSETGDAAAGESSEAAAE